MTEFFLRGKKYLSKLFLSKKGFTLIEVLIVVVIIGILAAALLPYASTTQARARDTARLFDMNSIAEALELYASSNRGRYPIAPIWMESSNKGGLLADINDWIVLADTNGGSRYGSNVGEVALHIGEYLHNIPTDPREGLTVLDKYGECEVDPDGGKHFAYYTDEIGLRYAITSMKESKRGNTHNCRGFVNAEGKGNFEVVGNGLYYLSQEGMTVDAEPPFRQDYIPPTPKDPTPPDPIDPGENPEYPAVDNGCFEFASNTIYDYLDFDSDNNPCPKNVTIPSQLKNENNILIPVTIIAENAFKEKGLTELTFNTTITSIGASAFQDNYLTEVVIPTSVISIGSKAFYGNKLEQFKISENVGTPFFGDVVQENGPNNNSFGIDSTGPHAFVENTDKDQEWVLIGQQRIKTDQKVTIGAEAFLQGALVNITNVAIYTDIMRDDIRNAELIPVDQPYSGAPHYYEGSESITDLTLLDDKGDESIVDRVLLELRDSVDPSQIVAKKAALIQRNGRIVSETGSTDIVFDALPNHYYLVLQHRNHLGVMTANSIDMIQEPIVDFKTADLYEKQGLIESPVFVYSGQQVLWGGDADMNGYLASSQDGGYIEDYVLNYPGNAFGSISYTNARGYSSSDINMDGRTMASAAGSDKTLLQWNIMDGEGAGGSVYYTGFQAHLP